VAGARLKSSANIANFFILLMVFDAENALFTTKIEHFSQLAL